MLRGERVTLRSIERDDLKRLHELSQNVEGIMQAAGPALQSQQASENGAVLWQWWTDLGRLGDQVSMVVIGW